MKIAVGMGLEKLLPQTANKLTGGLRRRRGDERGTSKSQSDAGWISRITLPHHCSLNTVVYIKAGF